MKNKVKYFLMFICMVLILLLTFNSIYDKNSIVSIVKNIRNIKLYYIFICLLIIFLYFMLQGVYIKLILKALRKKVSLIKGMFYSMVEFFFSGITPSATGGQPVELYYMKKDGIPIRKAYITLMLNTIFFKSIIIILGIMSLIFESNYIFSSKPIYIFFFMLGFIIDLFIVILCLFLVFKQNLIKIILTKLINLGKKVKLFRKKAENADIEGMTARYKDEIKFILTHKKIVFVAFIITFIQRLLLFSTAYVIYRALGFNYYSYFELLFIQVIVQITIEFAPISGGVGISEGMLHNLFIMIFAAEFADLGMLLTRAFSFYIPIIICLIAIIIYKIFSKKRSH